jgi:hypothetical protein
MSTRIKLALERSVGMLKNPRFRCVPDQITGKTYALCLMETEDKNDNRIQRHISYYMKPDKLQAFMEGYYECMKNYNKVLD